MPHTWGGQLQHHPHLHGVLPAGGIAADGSHWGPCRPNFFLPVRVLSRRFRRLYIEGLEPLYREGQLSLTGRCRPLAERKAWKRLLAMLRDKEWVVYFTDHKREGKLRTQTLDARAFLRRFVLHVLPRGLHNIRYFGFMANCQRHQRLSHCRTLLG